MISEVLHEPIIFLVNIMTLWFTSNDSAVSCASLSADCPPVVTITPSVGPFIVGDVLNCTSDSTLSSYSFTDSSGTVTAGNTITLSEEGWFNFTCTVIINIHVPCSASVSVSGTAISKKHLRIRVYVNTCIVITSSLRQY